MVGMAGGYSRTGSVSRAGSWSRASSQAEERPPTPPPEEVPEAAPAAEEPQIETLAELSQRMSNSTVEAGRTKVGVAAQQGNIRQVESHVFDGASTNEPDQYGETPLHLAAAAGHMEMVKFLVEECRAEINCTNWEGWSPLFWATVRGQVDVVKYLITMGADIQLQASQDWMPLHYASLNGDVEMVDILLSNGADVAATNAFGSTPLTLAVNKDVAALIQEATRKQTVKFRKPDTQPSPRQGRANQQRGRP